MSIASSEPSRTPGPATPPLPRPAPWGLRRGLDTQTGDAVSGANGPCAFLEGAAPVSSAFPSPVGVWVTQLPSFPKPQARLCLPVPPATPVPTNMTRAGSKHAQKPWPRVYWIRVLWGVPCLAGREPPVVCPPNRLPLPMGPG